MSTTAAPNMFPVLSYDDAAHAIEWLKTALGFEEHLVVRGEEGSIAHAELSLGSGVVMFASERNNQFRMKSPRELGATTGGTYIYIEDIDALYQRATAAGAEMVRELASTDYGSHEFTTRDSEGHLWHFGTYLPKRDS